MSEKHEMDCIGHHCHDAQRAILRRGACPENLFPNFLDHKSKKNRRNRNQYRMSDHHEPIVTKEQWRAVQKILESRRYGLKGGYVPLRVIEGGALQGFVSLHRQWAGAAPDDYYTASRTAYGKDLPDYLRWVDDEPAEEQEADDAEQNTEDEIPEPTPPKGGFLVVSMSLFSRADEPAMILTGHAFRFNVNCIKRMGGTTHVAKVVNLHRLAASRRIRCLYGCMKQSIGMRAFLHAR